MDLCLEVPTWREATINLNLCRASWTDHLVGPRPLTLSTPAWKRRSFTPYDLWNTGVILIKVKVLRLDPLPKTNNVKWQWLQKWSVFPEALPYKIIHFSSDLLISNVQVLLIFLFSDRVSELYFLILNLEKTFALKPVHLQKTVILKFDGQSHMKFCKIVFTSWFSHVTYNVGVI